MHIRQEVVVHPPTILWQVICYAPRGRLKVCAFGAVPSGVCMADPQEAHILAKRIKEVANNYDVFLTDAEEAHMCSCLECLKTFTTLVLHKDGGSLSA